ncbi:hypothetical protein YDYSY3_39100 [Paenibacillus chitinolyticus]|uniref:hypothetical protein n=1 Tax=Paenibacillus chitinolyticus TaxID=79263 RepID=UPI0026E4F586|nr:hypothetical protein [Paenibacillus chitinolyticus]GKS12910.1 hypothetical protein YDYSY3_39100 [Paenibacillus chitinolyticus]
MENELTSALKNAEASLAIENENLTANEHDLIIRQLTGEISWGEFLKQARNLAKIRS